MPSGVLTRVGCVQGTIYYMSAGSPQGKGQFLRVHCEVYVVSPCYSVGGSSDAASRCQYRSSLLVTGNMLLHVVGRW